MKKVSVCYGQDTAAYCNEIIDVDDSIANDPEQLKKFLIERALEIANNDDEEHPFEVDYAFMNLRIVDACIDGKTVLDGIQVENNYHGAGLALRSALNLQLPIQTRANSFLDAALCCGITEKEARQAIKDLYAIFNIAS
jgi:hypothetical protein